MAIKIVSWAGRAAAVYLLVFVVASLFLGTMKFEHVFPAFVVGLWGGDFVDWVMRKLRGKVQS